MPSFDSREDTESAQLNLAVRQAMETAAREMQIDSEPVSESVADRRRRGRQPERGWKIRVYDHDGVLVVDDGGLAPRIAGARRRRSGARRMRAANVAFEVPVKPLGHSQVVEGIRRLDETLTPRTGLFGVLPDGTLTANEMKPISRGRILLFVHGTFSNAETIFAQLVDPKNEGGNALLARAFAHYDQVLAFNHRTLSVGPAINARDLALHFLASQADVDVVCHSRGGLVSRWWVEALDPPRPGRDRRVVFVASPLQGTSLASPSNLKSALSLALNIQKGLIATGELAQVAFPFVAFATGFFRVTSALTRGLASTPALDAAVALVPGLRAMSRVENNYELETLRNEAPHPSAAFFNRHYFAIQADFEPDEVGWKFWKAFRKTGQRVADLAIDPIFDGPNDLVVDTSSMTSFVDAKSKRIDSARVKDFGKTTEVHHTSYFRHPAALDFVGRKLGF